MSESDVLNARIALFFENTVYLVNERQGGGGAGAWNFPGGRLFKDEDAKNGAFRKFNETVDNFNLERWAQETRNEFIEYNVYHGNDVSRYPHTIIFYCICNIKPLFNFKINKETIEGKWFDIPNYLPIIHLQDESVRRLIDELAAIGATATAPPIHDEGDVASAPPMDDDDDDFYGAIKRSLREQGGGRKKNITRFKRCKYSKKKSKKVKKSQKKSKKVKKIMYKKK